MAIEIPIKNIYYMLCYSYSILKEKDNINLSNEKFENVYDLFGKILVNGLRNLIKRGFNREYVDIQEETTVLRGKIEINETLKKQSHIIGKITCEYSEITSNVLFNQIIKASISKLMKYKNLNGELKRELKKISYYFSDIDSIELRKSHFKEIRYHRNNRFYKLIIDICELLFDELLVSSEKGKTIFKDFERDNGKMAKLYEKFILNFYKRESNENIKVHSPIIQWEKDCGFDHIGEESLPKMKTDIVLETKDKKLPRKQLIIDAKYYSNLLKSSNFSDVGKLIPGNLYQIYAYINNSEFKGTKIGMLIYPTVETEVDYVYSIQGKKIYIKTLNLNTDWVNIKSRLMEIQKYLEI
jgi:5-methylcytosine-specific restriction enzyme subunit McrC